MSDLGPDKNKIFENFKKQADLINEGTDFFYLDVMCSLEEAEIGINSIKHLNKEFIVGLHYKKDGKLPSGEYFIDVLKALNIEDKKSLIVFGTPNNNVYLSSRNFKGSEVVTSSEISTYKILNAKELVISESSLVSINENLSK